MSGQGQSQQSRAKQLALALGLVTSLFSQHVSAEVTVVRQASYDAGLIDAYVLESGQNKAMISPLFWTSTGNSALGLNYAHTTQSYDVTAGGVASNGTAYTTPAGIHIYPMDLGDNQVAEMAINRTHLVFQRFNGRWYAGPVNQMAWGYTNMESAPNHFRFLQEVTNAGVKTLLDGAKNIYGGYLLVTQTNELYDLAYGGNTGFASPPKYLLNNVFAVRPNETTKESFLVITTNGRIYEYKVGDTAPVQLGVASTQELPQIAKTLFKAAAISPTGTLTEDLFYTKNGQAYRVSNLERVALYDTLGNPVRGFNQIGNYIALAEGQILNKVVAPAPGTPAALLHNASLAVTEDSTTSAIRNGFTILAYRKGDKLRVEVGRGSQNVVTQTELQDIPDFAEFGEVIGIDTPSTTTGGSNSIYIYGYGSPTPTNSMNIVKVRFENGELSFPVQVWNGGLRVTTAENRGAPYHLYWSSKYGSSSVFGDKTNRRGRLYFNENQKCQAKAVSTKISVNSGKPTNPALAGYSGTSINGINTATIDNVVAECWNTDGYPYAGPLDPDRFYAVQDSFPIESSALTRGGGRDPINAAMLDSDNWTVEALALAAAAPNEVEIKPYFLVGMEEDGTLYTKGVQWNNTTRSGTQRTGSTNVALHDKEPVYYAATHLTNVTASDGLYPDKIEVNWVSPVKAVFIKKQIQWGSYYQASEFYVYDTKFTDSNIILPNNATPSSHRVQYQIFGHQAPRANIGPGRGRMTPSNVTAAAMDTGFMASPPTATSATLTIATNSSSDGFNVAVADRDEAKDYTYSILTQGQLGVASISPTGKLSYTAGATSGTDTFTYRVTDNNTNPKGYADGTATVTITCPPPELISITPPSKVKAWQENVISYKYRAASCNGNALNVTLKVGNSSTADIPALSKSTSIASSNNETTAVINLSNPDAGSYNLTLEIASASNPQNTATRTVEAQVVGLSNRRFVVTPTIPSEDELITAAVSLADKDCKFHATEVDAKAFRECYVEWTHPLADHRITPTEDAINLTGYGDVGGPHEIIAKVYKADSNQALRLVDTLVNSVYVTPGTPITFNQPSFSKAQRQFLDFIDFTLTQKTGQQCVISTSSTAASIQAQNGENVCLIEFIDLPAGLTVAADGSARVTGRLQGNATTATVRFRASKIFANKTPSLIAENEFVIPVQPTVFNGTLSLDRPEYARGVQVATATASIVGSPACSISTSMTEAKTSNGKAGELVCLGEWDNLPSWMTNKTGTKLIATGTVPNEPGEYPLAYTLFMVDQAGLKIPMGSFQAKVNVVDLPEIGLTVTPASQALTRASDSAPIYTMDGTGLVGSFTVQSAAFANVRATTMLGTALPVVTQGIKNGETKELRTQALTMPAWQISDLTVKVEYEGISDTSRTRTETIKVAQLPPKNMAALIEMPSEQPVNTLPFSLTGRVGVPTSSAKNLAYSAVAQGNWTAFIGALEQPNIVPLTAKLPVEDNGTVRFDGLTYTQTVGRDLVLVVEPVLPDGLAMIGSLQVISAPANLSFVSGTPITAIAMVDKMQGEAPHSVKLDIQVPQPEQANLGSVYWEFSTDNGTTWNDLDGSSSRSLTYRFAKGGNYLVRARVANKHSGAQTFTNIVAIDVTQTLKMTLTGPTIQLPGRPAKLDLTVQSKDGSALEYDTEWVVSSGAENKRTFADLQTLTLESDKIGTFDLMVRAKPKAMDGLKAESWTTIERSVRYAWPDPVKLSISGQRRIETGNTLALTAKVSSPALASMEAKGLWSVPEGVQVEGALNSPSVGLIFDPAIFADGDQVDVSYRAWIDGAEEKTQAVVTHRITLTKYEFANFVLSKKAETPVAPAYLRLQVEPANTTERKKIGSQKLTYTWAVPELEGVSAKAQANGLTLTVQMPGEYPISVTVADQRGNSQMLSYVLTVSEPSGHVIAMGLREGMKFNRAPMTFSMRPVVSGGHPSDRVAKFELFVNGQSILVAAGNRPPRTVNIPTAGEHTVKLAVTTDMQKTAFAEEKVTVNPNQPPVCEDLRVVWDRHGTSSSVTSNCKDVDGRLKGYRWYINGELQEKRQGNRINLGPEQIGSSAEVKLEVLDDSAAVTTQIITLTPPGASQ